MNKNLDVVEDIKQNITDNQYKTIMDSFMEIHRGNNSNKLPLLSNDQERNKFMCLFNWLDPKLEITESKNDCINRRDLYKVVNFNYFNYSYDTTFNFVKTFLNLYFTFSAKKQMNCTYFEYVRYRAV